MKNKIYGNFYPEQIHYRFNVFPSHSISFFVKKNLHKKIGLYDDNFNFCADYDFILKLVNQKISYACSKPNEVFGKFAKGGISSNISIFKKTSKKWKSNFLGLSIDRRVKKSRPSIIC